MRTPWPVCLAAFVSIATPWACSARPDEAGGPGRSNMAMFTESQAYERFMGRWSRRLAPEFLTFARLDGARSVLDVGCGTGALASAVLATIGPDRVVGIDLSAAYVDEARSSTADARAAFEVGDGQRLRFDDASFDAAVSLLVINFIPDPGKALDEMIRVTRPGGVVAAAVWDYDEGMEMLRAFWDEAVALDPSSEARDERHMPFARAGELADLWRAHGLVDVEDAPVVVPIVFDSFDDFWSPFLDGQGPAGAYVAARPESRRRDLERRLRERLLTAGNGSISLRARAWAVRGRVSGTGNGG